MNKYYGLQEFEEHEDREVLYTDLISEAKTVGGISDGYHTFDELYEHRITLYIALCRSLQRDSHVPHSTWRSRIMSNGDVWDGWFLLGINKEPGWQITYHLPDSKWELCDFAETLEKAPKFDGHTSADVLERIGRL